MFVGSPPHTSGKFNESHITAERLKKLLSYDACTGRFIWRENRGVKNCGGKIAGSDRHGYWVIRVESHLCAAHRLAWLYVHGHWPSGYVDHINGDSLDNRIANLRDVSHVVNMQNQRSATAHSQTGLLGCHPQGNKFQAEIKVDGRIKYLGIFKTAQEGHEAYLKAKRLLHEGCTI